MLTDSAASASIAPPAFWSGVRQVLSPHCDARPPGCARPHRRAWHQPAAGGVRRPVDRPAVHRQSAAGRAPVFRGASRGCASRRMRSSGATARSPSTCRSARAPGTRAVEYRGRAACNDFSIGIELEGTDEVPYTDAQYDSSQRSSARAVAALSDALAPSASSGTATSRRAARPIPGPAFDWPRLRDGLTRRPETSACVGLPRSCRHSTSRAALVPRQHARQHEQQVRQPVEVLQHSGADRLVRASAHSAARRGGDGARQVAGRGAGPPPGSMNSLQRRQRGVEARAPARAASTCCGRDEPVPRDAQLTTQVEQVVLHLGQAGASRPPAAPAPPAARRVRC